MSSDMFQMGRQNKCNEWTSERANVDAHINKGRIQWTIQNGQVTRDNRLLCRFVSSSHWDHDRNGCNHCNHQRNQHIMYWHKNHIIMIIYLLLLKLSVCAGFIISDAGRRETCTTKFCIVYLFFTRIWIDRKYGQARDRADERMRQRWRCRQADTFKKS